MKVYDVGKDSEIIIKPTCAGRSDSFDDVLYASNIATQKFESKKYSLPCYIQAKRKNEQAADAIAIMLSNKKQIAAIAKTFDEYLSCCSSHDNFVPERPIARLDNSNNDHISYSCPVCGCDLANYHSTECCPKCNKQFDWGSRKPFIGRKTRMNDKEIYCLLCGKSLPINGRGSAKIQVFICKKCQSELLNYDKDIPIDSKPEDFN